MYSALAERIEMRSISCCIWLLTRSKHICLREKATWFLLHSILLTK